MMTNLSASPAIPAPRPSPWAVAAGLVALTLLFLVSGGGWLIVLLGIGLVGPYFTNHRLETESYLRWMIRIAIVALIYQVSQGLDESGRSASLAVGSVGLRTLFGQIYAAEMVVQAWRRRDAGGHQATLSVVLFSALVYLTACNVFNEQLVTFITPVYMLFVAFALREWRSRTVPAAVPGVAAVSPDARRRTLTVMQRVSVILLTLGLGFGATRSVTVFKDSLNDLGNRLLVDQRMFENLGMSSQPELGSAFNLRGGTNRILRVLNLAGDGHLRGATFVEYESGRWGPALRRYNFTVADSESLSPLQPLYGNQISRSRDDMTITRLTNMSLLFAPTNAVGVTTGDELDTRERVEWSIDAGGVMRNRANPPYNYIVTMASDAPSYQGPFAQPILAEKTPLRERYLQVLPEKAADGKPNKDGAYMRTLTGQITKDAPTAPEKIIAVTQHLLNNHKYSLSTNVGQGDPVASFLREKKDAHCEFFAASATILLRYAGVPTRYVTGYLAHEPGQETGETIVRQRDAHAWCEAWVDGVGWVAVDATPGDGRPDEMVQEKVSAFQRINEWFQDTFQKLKDRLADIPPAVLNLIVVASALLPLGIYIVYSVTKAKRARALMAGAGFAYTMTDETLAALSARFEQAFAKAGRPLKPEATYTEQLAVTKPDALSETGRQFARLYEVARFGGRRDRETFDTLTGLVEQTEQNADQVRDNRKR
ncbi:MAG: transglutaminase domain-containing protein [Akkermansiaceae bacterium]|nr:transglutaminase domain-containing protein [Armatimonadota bacterium]